MDHLVSDIHLIVAKALLEHFKYFPWSRLGGMETGVGNFLPEHTIKNTLSAYVSAFTGNSC